MEDIIYILIGIAWIGFSIYSQQKKLKKKQQEAKKARGTDNYQAEEKAEQEETSLFDRLFEEHESGQEYEPELEPETYRQQAGVSEKPDWKTYGTVEQVTSKADIVESNSKLSADYYDLGKDKIKDPKKQAKKSDKSYDYDYEYEDKKSVDFDLRSAVIYSAILDRPYD